MIRAKFRSFSSFWRFFWPLGFLFLLLIPTFWPFFHRGFFPSHDNVQVVRVFEMFQSIKYGDFPPRWSSGLIYGHGYPLYTFYSPFSYMIATFFVFLGLNFLVATKVVFILGFLLGGLGMFLLVKEWWGRLPALTAAIVFSYAPYRAVDVYVRGNLAEFFAFSLLPFAMLANWKLLTSERKGIWLLIFSFLTLILIITHNLTFFIFFIFLFFFNLYYLSANSNNRFENLLSLIKSGLLSLASSCFYWLPLLYEKKFVLLDKFSSYPYQLFFLTLRQLWSSPWGFGGFHQNNPMSLQLGKVIIVFTCLALVLNFLLKTKYKNLLIFFGVSFIVSSFLELKFSKFIWGAFPILSYLQFPWRFHIITSFLGAVLIASIIYVLKEKIALYRKRPLGKYLPLGLYFLVAVVLFFHLYENIGFFKPNYYTDEPMVSETTTWDDEYLPKWVKSKPKDYAKEKIIFVKGSGVIEDKGWGYLQKSFLVDAKETSVIQIAHIYYPGWKAFIDGRKTEIMYDNKEGLMEITLPEGKSMVVFKFLRTPIRVLAELVSLLGMAVFASALVIGTMREKD